MVKLSVFLTVLVCSYAAENPQWWSPLFSCSPQNRELCSQNITETFRQNLRKYRNSVISVLAGPTRLTTTTAASSTAGVLPSRSNTAIISVTDPTSEASTTPSAGSTSFNEQAMERAASVMFQTDSSLIAGFVRMIFHDCVGGCDGCIDVNSPDNAGLSGIVNRAQSFRAVNAPSLSQADINVFLGIKAVEEGIRRAGGTISLTFNPGRTNCDSRTTPSRRLPAGNKLDSIQFLVNEFRLSQREAVALLGCHSLGGARPENSGFDGPWDLTTDKLDSGFFKNLVEPGWVHQTLNNSRVLSTQWSKRGPFMMLHSDMILLKQFTISGPDDKPSCTYNTCPPSSSAEEVREYAVDMGSFHKDLQSAFTKMINH